MVEFTPKAKFSIAAAAVGLFSLLVPWVSFTLTNGKAIGFGGESPVQLLTSFLTPASGGLSPDPLIAAWQRSAEVGYAWWTVGVVVFLTGCLVALAQSFTSSREGWIWMLAGTAVSTAGIESFSTQFTTSSDVVVTVGPYAGWVLALIACLLAFIPVLRVDARDRWVRDPRSAGWSKGVQFYVAAPAVDPLLPAARAPGGAGTASDTNPGGGRGAPSGEASPPAEPARRFCPECGAWYLGGEAACAADGSPTRPVRVGGARKSGSAPSVSP